MSDQSTRAIALESCQRGDLGGLKRLLDAHPAPDTPPPTSEMLVTACKAKHISVLQYLLERDPNTKSSLELHKAAFQGGVDVYSVILEKFPELKQETFGHQADPISQAVSDNDIVMLEFLLDNGFDVKTSHFCYVPVLVFAQQQDSPEEIIHLLKKWGATDELSL
ncbi:MAG: hypothetical protein ASARMPREDX12_004149 [Alectoria sarmentosa]|nr:MAG: hypothetical protein ASARMPREDX12_004149 [Alectoria sarmentosa]CAD6584332.1 MAG: hypothetical protein ASARMPRED_001736 [Alectoria sarmentosa]